MRLFSRRLLAGGLILATKAVAWDFNNNFYAVYQRPDGDGTIIHVVPRQSTLIETHDLWPVPMTFVPDIPGLTLTLDAAGTVTGFSANALTTADMPGLAAAPSSYAASVDDADGDGRADLLLKNPVGTSLVIGSDVAGSVWVTSQQALSRERYSIGPANVLVVYDIGNSHVGDADVLAEQYRVAREIPLSNVLAVDFSALTGINAAAQSCTRSQLLPLIAAVRNAIAASGHAIRVILFVGDFPGAISDVYYDGNGRNIGFFDAFLAPGYFSALASGGAGTFAFSSLNSLYWKDNASNYPDPVPSWHFSTPAAVLGNAAVNPAYNPAPRGGEGYAVFNIPLNVLSDPSLFWRKAIGAEQAHYSDWGSVILYGGTDRNPTSRHFLEEARYEGHNLSHFYWSSLNTTTETGLVLFASALADKDSSNFTAMPGDVLFSAGALADLFFISPGARSYYDMTHATETVGDYHYRDGAIALFGQSFGAVPATTAYLNANKRPLLVAMTATPAQTQPSVIHASVLAKLGPATPPFALLTFGYSGDARDNARLSIVNNAGVFSIVATGPAGESFSLAITQNNLRAFFQAVRAAVATTSRWSVTLAPGATQRFMSRAAAALAAGATVSIGAGAEPLSSGDPNTYALFTTLWYGGNLAEWQLRQRAGFRADNNKGSNLTHWVETPVALVMYGDPLYAPFRWRARRHYLNP